MCGKLLKKLYSSSILKLYCLKVSEIVVKAVHWVSKRLVHCPSFSLAEISQVFKLLCKTLQQIYKIRSNLTKLSFFLQFWWSINLPWGHVRSNTKFGPNKFSRFDVFRLQTNKQTPKQAKYIWYRRRVCGLLKTNNTGVRLNLIIYEILKLWLVFLRNYCVNILDFKSFKMVNI